jgi:glycosyltransferase involved in cell wall biosynthesis
MTPGPTPPAPGAPRGPILCEVDNLTLKAGTGIATYGRNLAGAARRLGHEVDGLIGVERGLSRNDRRLNEILAFDAAAIQPESFLDTAMRYARYPVNALGGIRPVEVSRSGLVVGPVAENFRVFDRLYAATRLMDRAAAHFKIYGRLAQLRFEASPWLFHATQPAPLAVMGSANIYTIHDLVPLRLPYTTSDDKRYFYRMLSTLARTADRIVTVSEHSRRDIIEFLNVDERRIVNTYQAVEIPESVLQSPDDEVADDLAKAFGLEFGEYFVFCGAIEPKKNVSRLIDAYVASGTKRPLILTGSKGWHNEDDMRKIHDGRFVSFRMEGNAFVRRRQVRHLPYLPRRQLLHLMKGARALLFPSIYEGFGLPVVEAMLLGTPVVTSNLSSLPEVAGDAAVLVDPYSVDSIRRAIEAVDADQDLRRDLAIRGHVQAARFSIEAYTERLRTLYASL